MIAKINRFVFLLLIVAVALYVVIMNRDPLVVNLGSDSNVTASSGVVLLVVFGLGILAASLVAVFFGIKSYFRERSLKRRERRRLAFYEGMVKARNLVAAGEWRTAQSQWESLIADEYGAGDPTNVIARLELSKVYESLGDQREALRTVDAARVADPHNVEVLMRAAELNRALGNRTAAVDNLALVISEVSAVPAIKAARDLSFELGRIDDALEYQGKLAELVSDTEANTKDRIKLEFAKELKSDPATSTPLLTRLRAFIRANGGKISGEEVLVYDKLADLELSAGDQTVAAETLLKAGKISGRAEYWFRAAKIWVEKHEPDRAISTARAATKETRGAERIQAELNLIRIYTALNMYGEACKIAEGVRTVAIVEEFMLPPLLQFELFGLHGAALAKSGQHQKAADLWRTLQGETPVLDQGLNGNLQSEASPPARLSTP